MESINDQLKMLEILKKELNTSDNINDTIRVVSEIIDIYKQLSNHIDNVGVDTIKLIDYHNKAINLQVLLTQLEIQNEALISRMKSVINN